MIKYDICTINTRYIMLNLWSTMENLLWNCLNKWYNFINLRGNCLNEWYNFINIL